MPGKMLSSKNSNIKSGLKNQPTPTLDKEPKISPPELSKILYYSNLADFITKLAPSLLEHVN